MSIATSNAPRRTRKPRLKVVGGDRRLPRHRAVWSTGVLSSIVEFWTIAEWNALPDWEKPGNAGFLPDIGYVHLLEGEAARAERQEVTEEYSDNIVAWGMAKGSDRY